MEQREYREIMKYDYTVKHIRVKSMVNNLLNVNPKYEQIHHLTMKQDDHWKETMMN
jgi:hypothetical protein